MASDPKVLTFFMAEISEILPINILPFFIYSTRLLWEVTSREEDKDSSLGEEATQPTLMYAR